MSDQQLSELGDRLVGYVCIFGLGFCVAIIVLGL
jgi:hypothetical protein